MAYFRLLLVPTTLSPLSPPIPSLHVSRLPTRHAHLSSICSWPHRRVSIPLIHHREKRNSAPRTVKVSSQLKYPIIAPDDHWGTWTALFAAGAFGLWYAPKFTLQYINVYLYICMQDNMYVWNQGLRRPRLVAW